MIKIRYRCLNFDVIKNLTEEAAGYSKEFLEIGSVSSIASSCNRGQFRSLKYYSNKRRNGSAHTDINHSS